MDPAPPAAPAPFRVCGIAGSLRAASYNRALLRAAQELAPAHWTIGVFDLAPLPLFNADLLETGPPEAVTALKRAVRSADALLLVSPEYNYGVPGVLKNALDWASRPPRESPLIGKPAGIMGASPGFAGTARGQAMLRMVLAGTHTPAFLTHEVYVAHADERFDAAGRLTDEPTRAHVRQFLVAFEAWARGQQPR
jgi:chromate reductase, NAD(P)H dehydrogenase (quinone)